MTGIELVGTFSNGISAQLTSGYNVSPEVFTQRGEQELTISAFGKTVKQPVYVFTEEEAGETLNDCTWATINFLAQQGLLLNYYNIGDTKTITLNGKVLEAFELDNFETRAYLIGYNHYSSTEGQNLAHFQIGKDITLNNRIGFYNPEIGTKQLTTEEEARGQTVMNLTATNVGGWTDCYMRHVVLGNDGTPLNPPEGSFMAILPEDLRKQMKTCHKYTYKNSSSYTDDYLCLMSEYEEWGSTGWSTSEGSQYKYYANGNSKVSYEYDEPTVRLTLWRRSPNRNNNTQFCSGNDGKASNQANYCYGISPLFFV